MSELPERSGVPVGRGRPLLIGLTGGIASGKSTVADHLARLGAQVIDADQLAVAITNLEAGQTLTPDHANLLRETVAKLEPQPEAAPARIGILAKHLELLRDIH